MRKYPENYVLLGVFTVADTWHQVLARLFHRPFVAVLAVWLADQGVGPGWGDLFGLHGASASELNIFTETVALSPAVLALILMSYHPSTARPFVGVSVSFLSHYTTLSGRVLWKKQHISMLLTAVFTPHSPDSANSYPIGKGWQKESWRSETAVASFHTQTSLRIGNRTCGCVHFLT